MPDWNIESNGINILLYKIIQCQFHVNLESLPLTEKELQRILIKIFSKYMCLPNISQYFSMGLIEQQNKRNNGIIQA